MVIPVRCSANISRKPTSNGRRIEVKASSLFRCRRFSSGCNTRGFAFCNFDGFCSVCGNERNGFDDRGIGI